MAYAIEALLPLRLFHRPDWCSESIVGGPFASSNPSFQGPVIQPSYSRPFSERMGDALMGYQSIRSNVVHLIHLCRPSTIGRRVAERVVDAVNGMTRRALSHVGKKTLEIIKPQWIYRDFSIVSGSLTPILHASPRSVGQWVQTAEPLRSLGDYLVSQASATLRDAMSDGKRINQFFRSALASAQPCAGARLGNHGPSIKSLGLRSHS